MSGNTNTRQQSMAVRALDRSLTARYTESQRLFTYQVLTFGLTFVSYMLYHANRKVVGVVKQVWTENCTQTYPDNNNSDPTWCDWAPFDRDNSDSLLGYMDASFLMVYALSMFLSGVLAERSNLRVYLSGGMLLAGAFNLLVGAGYWMEMHSYEYFLIINMLAGMFQATGWPAVVALMGNWFGRSKRGFIMGVWNIHTSVGNMFGSAVAGAFVSSNWGFSFAVPATFIMAFSVPVVLFTVPHPADVGLDDPNQGGMSSVRRSSGDSSGVEERRRLLSYEEPPYATPEDEHTASTSLRGGSVSHRRAAGAEGATSSTRSNNSCRQQQHQHQQAIGILTAVLIPGVITYSVALFFIKFVNYVFMFWLPMYIHSSTTFSAQMSAYMSMFFDMGGIMGGMSAGALSDKFKKPANVCFTALVISVPMLYLYYQFGGSEVWLSALLLIITGYFVSAPYALITTAVSAELGQHESLQGNSKALATVSAIIDGTGSLGAAFGPLLTGVVADNYGWQSVFYMLMLASGVAILCLVQLVVQEWRRAFSTPSTSNE